MTPDEERLDRRARLCGLRLRGPWQGLYWLVVGDDDLAARVVSDPDGLSLADAMEWLTLYTERTPEAREAERLWRAEQEGS